MYVRITQSGSRSYLRIVEGFRDEHGNAQIIPAEVDVYVAPADEPSSSGGSDRGELVAAALESIATSNNGHGTQEQP